MIRHNHNWLKKCYFRCPLDNLGLVSDTPDGDLKDDRDEDDNIVISDSTFHSLLPPQLKQMSARYKVMCSCECCISDKIIHLSLLSWRDRYLEKLKDQSHNDQNRSSSEKSHHIYETYKNTGMSHGRHIYAKAYDMSQATMCAYTQSGHALPHWKYVLRCCSDFPFINIPYQEIDNHNSETTPSINFRIYHIIVCCTSHGIIPLKDKKNCYMYKKGSSSDESTK